MPRPERKVDAETVRRLAEYAGLPLSNDRVELQLGFLKDQLQMMKEWENLRLGFWFEGGRLSLVKPPVVYRPPWEVPVPINKHRVVSTTEEGQ